MTGAVMQRTFLYAAYGYLCFAGVLHFIIDVMSQYLRGQRAPSSETTLYYGLHSAYSLSQVLFATMALLIIRSGSDLMSQSVSFALSFLATGARGRLAGPTDHPVRLHRLAHQSGLEAAADRRGRTLPWQAHQR